MYGNDLIKNNILWGIQKIYNDEKYKNDQIICDINIDGNVYYKVFNYDPQIEVGFYLITHLCNNYVYKGDFIELVPDAIIKLPKYHYFEFYTLEVLKEMHFGDIQKANKFISIFGDNFLTCGKIINEVSE